MVVCVAWIKDRVCVCLQHDRTPCTLAVHPATWALAPSAAAALVFDGNEFGAYCSMMRAVLLHPVHVMLQPVLLSVLLFVLHPVLQPV